jgi:hypothetical protein
MDHVLYFTKPYTEWKLIKFLKRKKYKQAQQDTSWKDEYETYERHINLIFDEQLQKKVYKAYMVILNFDRFMKAKKLFC